jgi:hypothetical protein
VKIFSEIRNTRLGALCCRLRTGANLIRCLAGWAMGCLLAGCAVMGPPSIRNGRGVYNEAINDTNNQQMLMVIIRDRYSETASLLAVSSVTANVSVATSAGIQLGFGNESNYRGNLIPFSASAIYEENPTVSYTPVEGQKYLRQVASPISLSILMPLCESAFRPGRVLMALVSRANDLANPAFLAPPAKPDPRFLRLVELVTRLGQAEVLDWVARPGGQGGPSVFIHHYRPAYEAEVRELLGLLDLPGPAAGAGEIVVPVSLGPAASRKAGITFITRSVYDLVGMLSAAVDIPAEDIQSGAVTAYPPAGPLGRGLQIHRTKAKPDRAYVRVQYHDWWYYIDKADRSTKGFFQLLTVLWSATIAETTAKGQTAPILMLPASR